MGDTNIQTLSAIPDNLPSSSRRRSSSWPSLNSSSLDKGAPVGFAFVGVFWSERCRTRSYKAWRRELVGVCGTVLASGPRWCTGVEGTDLSEAVGVSHPDSEGVRALMGVLGFPSLAAECREEGVFGKRIRFVEGVLKIRSVDGVLKMRSAEGVLKIRFVVGVPSLLEGVAGNGTAKSRSFLLGNFEGDLDAERVGEPGGCGAARIEKADGDLGDEEARRRVKFDGFWVGGREGRSAVGIGGTRFSFS